MTKDDDTAALIERARELAHGQYGHCSTSLDLKTWHMLLHLAGALERATADAARMREQKDGAYAERDRLVAALSKVFPSWLERHPDADTSWEDDWRWVVFIAFPTGQASWHIHDSELAWFDHLERRGGNSWDGHTTPEKYERVAALEPRP